MKVFLVLVVFLSFIGFVWNFVGWWEEYKLAPKIRGFKKSE